MLEFVPNRTYIVGHSTAGLIVGKFLGVDRYGALRFGDVTEIVEVTDYEDVVLSSTGVVDAEPWRQDISLAMYAETKAAQAVALDLASRPVVVIPRCSRVTVDSK